MPDSRKVIIMAVRTQNNTQAAGAAKQPTGQTAGFTLTGILKEVYVGKKYCYATITVNTGGQYYDKYKVQYALDTDFPDDGSKVNCCGTMSTFKAETHFHGTMIAAVSNS